MLTCQVKSALRPFFFNWTDLNRIIKKVTLNEPLNTLLYIIKFEYGNK